MNWIKTVRLLLLVIISLGACKNKAKTEIKTKTIEFTKEGQLSLFKGDSLITKLDIEIADTEYETQTGLMYRESMKDHQGMLFVFPDVTVHSFYMKNTIIPLDILFVDEGLKLTTIRKNAQPFDESPLSSEVPIKYVLEVNAGLADQWNLAQGDSISFSVDP